MEDSKVFVNGFSSWMETHFEIVSVIAVELSKDKETTSETIKKRYEAQGTGGMYELAEELTDEFEKLNEGRAWDGEFYDEVYDFTKEKLEFK